MLTATIRRLTVVFFPTFVVVLRTVIRTWSGPQRSAWYAVPLKAFLRVTVSFFGAAAFSVAATAPVTGVASASALRPAPTALLMGVLSRSEGEALGMDLPAWDTGVAHRAASGARHRRRAANASAA